MQRVGVVRYLLDTCTFLWLVQQPAMLSPAAVSAINDPASELFVSDVSLWEITLKHAAGKLPLPDYFRLYHEIDLSLDTFPYAGGTTTCDSLWMGVPVVSLAGQTAVGRGGVSILSNIGLPELATHSHGDYVRAATDLASDLPRLARLRSNLRDMMLASPLTNAGRFARNMEASYRTIWRQWCAAGGK